MYIVAIALLTLNLFLMLFFYFRIKCNFSATRYEELLQESMSNILRDFHFQTNQAITVLEERIEEMKSLICDADKRFIALSKKMSASNKQQKMLSKQIFTENMREDETLESVDLPQEELPSSDSPVASCDALPQQPSSQMNKQNPPSYEDLRVLSPDVAQHDAILKMKIVEMFRNGWSVDFIADKLKISREEVKIITFMASAQD